MLAIALICGVLAAGCVPVERPIRPRPTVGPMLTRVPAPIPRPTASPLGVAITTVTAPGWGLRTVSAPDAPVALAAPESDVVNVVCVGDCITNGGPSWVTSDARVAWTHPDPLSVDYYEVWTAIDQAYCDSTPCPEGYEQVGTTTGLELVVENAPPGFNPVGGTEGASIMSRIVVAHVRACNVGGCSAPSNEIGAVNYSLLQGISRLPEPGGW